MIAVSRAAEACAGRAAPSEVQVLTESRAANRVSSVTTSPVGGDRYMMPLMLILHAFDGFVPHGELKNIMR